MYDEFVKRLREEAECPDNFPEDSNLMREAADAIEELSADCDMYRKGMTDEHNKAARLLWDKEHCWIPVTERLPESGVPTLICGDGNVVEQGFFDDEYGYWYDWGGNRTFVHHWMPLPQPPSVFNQVNHRDENKENNRADNLEWCDGMYNTHYGTAIERMRERRWGNAPTIIQASKEVNK